MGLDRPFTVKLCEQNCCVGNVSSDLLAKKPRSLVNRLTAVFSMPRQHCGGNQRGERHILAAAQ